MIRVSLSPGISNPLWDWDSGQARRFEAYRQSVLLAILEQSHEPAERRSIEARLEASRHKARELEVSS